MRRDLSRFLASPLGASRALLFACAAIALAVAALPARAQAAGPSFVARVDRGQVPVDDSFIYEVTLSLESGRLGGFSPPSFKGFRVLSERPSQSTQIQMLGGNTQAQIIYSWRYELAPEKEGTFTIAPARARVNGRELATDSVPVTIGAAAGGSRRARAAGARAASPFGLPNLLDEPAAVAPVARDTGNFLRVVPDKKRAYVGEPVTVTWYLYLTARQDKYLTIVEPRADGFWSEEIELPGAGRGLQLTQDIHEGRPYLVAPLLRRALFPLQTGRLRISPMESEISQVDFFGSTMQTQRLKAPVVEIEALPLPREGQPPGFDPSNVGRFSIAARVDQSRVVVGEAVTLTLAITGQGNLRRMPLPKIETPEGWKSYEPKVQVTMEPGDVIAGTKTIEQLLLPERPGTAIIPAVTLSYFDPSAQRYLTQKTDPLRVEVVAEGRPVAANAGAGTSAGSAIAAAPAGVENVLPLEVRPPRQRGSLRRDLGASFYRSDLFVATLVAPPVAFGLTIMIGRVRERLGKETERGRRRKLRKLVRKRLRAAEAHVENGQSGAFYIEIDRVMRDFLSAKLGRSVAGLSREELRALLSNVGLGDELTAQVITELEECDRARFAPGSVDETEMRADLARAEEIIVQVEKAKLRSEALA